MAQDFITAFFSGGNPALRYQSQDAYDWLADSDDEDGRLKSTSRLLLQRFDQQRNPVSRPAVSIEPQSSNKKRAIEATSCEANSPEAKRMKVEIKQGDGAGLDRQARTTVRPAAINTSIPSPPSVFKMESTEHPDQNDYLQQTSPPQVQPQIHQPQHHNSSISMRTPDRPPKQNNQPSQAKQVIAATTVAAAAPQAYFRPWEQPSQPVMKIEEPQAPPSITSNTKVPFVIDDSSSDEESTPGFPHARASRVVPKDSIPAAGGVPRPQMHPAHREQQLAESRKRRLDAEQRKRVTPSSSGVRENGGELSGARVHVKMSHSNDTPLDQAAQRALSNTKLEPANAPDGSIIDLTRDGDTDGKARVPLQDTHAQYIDQQRQRAKELMEVKRQGDLHDRARVEARGDRHGTDFITRPSKSGLQQRDHLKMQVGHDEQTKKPAQVTHHGDRHMKALEEAQRKKAAELRARFAQIDAEESERAELRKTVEVERQVQGGVQQSVKHNPEDAQRNLAIAEAQKKLEAQRKRDAEKEAAAEEEVQRKRVLEQQQWDGRKKVQEAQREALRKRQAVAEKEKSVLDDRQAALARCGAVRSPQPVRKDDPPLVGSGSSIGDVIANVKKHASIEGLRFMDPGDEGIAADIARKRLQEIKERSEQDRSNRLSNDVPARMERTEGHRQLQKTVDSSLTRRKIEEQRLGGCDEGKSVLKDDDQPPLRDSGLDAKPAPTYEGGHQRRDSRVPTPQAPTLPTGPVSLRRAAEQGILPHAATPQAKAKGASATPSKSHSRQLGEILPQDIQLLRWRDNGILLSEISSNLWPKTFGTPRAIKTLRERYKQVKDALKTIRIDDQAYTSLLNRVQRGDAEARAELNRKVHGVWPLPVVRGREDGAAGARGERAQGNERPRDARGHFLPVNHRPTVERALPGATSQRAASTWNPLQSFGSSNTEGTLTHEDEREAEPRSHIGGKIMNAAVFHHYLEQNAEAYAEMQAESEKNEEAGREQSPICQDDAYHFTYQVQRREMTQKDLDDGWKLEDDPWQLYGEPYDNLDRANAKASRLALEMPKAWKVWANARDYDISTRTPEKGPENGCVTCSVVWRGVGQVQTCVTRGINYYDSTILPTSKDGWAPRTIYFVRSRTTTKTKVDDELFDNIASTDTTINVDDAVYAVLAEANDAAIKHFVSIAYSSKSARLEQRAMDVAEVEGRVAEELEDDGEDRLFEREVEDEEGRRKVVVWVEEGKLRGPRNL